MKESNTKTLELRDTPFKWTIIKATNHTKAARFEALKWDCVT